MTPLLSEEQLRDLLKQLAEKTGRSYRGLQLYLREFVTEQTENIPEGMTGYVRSDLKIIERAISISDLYDNHVYAMIKTIMTLQDRNDEAHLKAGKAEEELEKLSDIRLRYDNSEIERKQLEEKNSEIVRANRVQVEGLEKQIATAKETANAYARQKELAVERSDRNAWIGIFLLFVGFVIGAIIF